jgi:hypothetical protein
MLCSFVGRALTSRRGLRDAAARPYIIDPKIGVISPIARSRLTLLLTIIDSDARGLCKPGLGG